MKRAVIWALATILVAVGLYWYVQNGPPVLALPAESIQKSLDVRFPRTTTADGVKVSVTDPFVDLVGGADRVAFSVSLVLALPASGTVPGSARLSASVRYDPGKRVVELGEVDVDELKLATIAGVRVPSNESLRAALRRDVCPALVGLRLHDLNAERVTEGPLELEDVRVSEGDLQITFRSR